MATIFLKEPQSMTEGNVRKILVSFAIPIMLGNLLQQVYSMVDTAVVGQGVSYQALASVGVAFPVVQLFLGVGIGLSNGLSVVIAQKFGSGDLQRTRRAVTNGIYLSALATLCMTLFGLLFCRSVFLKINTPAEVLADAVLYTQISVFGSAATVFYNVQAGILRALGNSRIPLLFLIVTSLLNVLLDLLFVMVFGWGVAGAAGATVLSQMISCVLCFLFIKKHIRFLLLEPGDWLPDRPLLLEQIRVGAPMAFFDCILYVSFLLLQAPLNSLGSVSMAAYTAASKVDSLVMRILNAFGTAVSTFAAQNKGNSSFGRVREGARACVRITVGISIGATLLAYLFAGYFMRLFVGARETEIIAAGVQYLRMTSLFYVVLGINFTIRFVLIGLGKSSVPFIVAILEVIVRSASTFFLVKRLGFLGITLPNPLCWITSTVLIAVLYPGMLKQMETLSGGNAKWRDFFIMRSVMWSARAKRQF